MSLFFIKIEQIIHNSFFVWKNSYISPRIYVKSDKIETSVYTERQFPRHQRRRLRAVMNELRKGLREREMCSSCKLGNWWQFSLYTQIMRISRASIPSRPILLNLVMDSLSTPGVLLHADEYMRRFSLIKRRSGVGFPIVRHILIAGSIWPTTQLFDRNMTGW